MYILSIFFIIERCSVTEFYIKESINIKQKLNVDSINKKINEKKLNDLTKIEKELNSTERIIKNDDKDDFLNIFRENLAIKDNKKKFKDEGESYIRPTTVDIFHRQSNYKFYKLIAFLLSSNFVYKASYATTQIFIRNFIDIYFYFMVAQLRIYSNFKNEFDICKALSNKNIEMNSELVKLLDNFDRLLSTLCLLTPLYLALNDFIGDFFFTILFLETQIKEIDSLDNMFLDYKNYYLNSSITNRKVKDFIRYSNLIEKIFKDFKKLKKNIKSFTILLKIIKDEITCLVLKYDQKKVEELLRLFFSPTVFIKDDFNNIIENGKNKSFLGADFIIYNELLQKESINWNSESLKSLFEYA